MSSRFPNPENVPADEPAAIGGALSCDWLLDAYAHGYFPWYSERQPILWWCPDPRFVLATEDVRISRSLGKELEKDWWRVTLDAAFEQVIRACATRPRKGQVDTWIVEDMVQAYCALHEHGFAHSVECWQDETLVGGLYGVSLGTLFFGESMFHTVPNASKLAFVTLVQTLQDWGIDLIDCQQPTDYLASFGAVSWPRSRFLKELHRRLGKPSRQGPWTLCD